MQEDTSTQVADNPPQQQQSDPGLTAITQEQWQQFTSQLAAQNQELVGRLNQAQHHIVEANNQSREAALEKLDDKSRAEAYKAELDTIKNTARQAQAQQISENVWQKRDADSAVKILQLNGLDGTEAELYRGNWDVNWMPRFVASVEQTVKSRAAKTKSQNNPAENPANRANVSQGNAIPDIDPNASGYDTIRYALSKMK